METLGLKIGDRILIDTKPSAKSKNGTIRFGGSTEFAVGHWAGVELDEPIGLFVPMHRITKAPPTRVAAERRKKSANGGSGVGKRESVALSPHTFEAHKSMVVNTDLQVGERVSVGGSRTGTLRFAGTVKFAPGIWMGVELDHSHGKNDGSRAGVRYFRCRPNHGVFVLPSKVKRLSPAATSVSSNGATGTDVVDLPPPSTSSSSPSPHSSPPVTKRRLAVSNTSKAAPRAKQPRTSSSSHPPPSTPSSSSLSLSSLPNVTLETGMNVFVQGAEFGVVRFIGQTAFSEGVWLGIELRRPNGKNDGSVKGKRYFHCKPLYGLFVKPEKATHRGINCAKILPPAVESSLERST